MLVVVAVVWVKQPQDFPVLHAIPLTQRHQNTTQRITHDTSHNSPWWFSIFIELRNSEILVFDGFILMPKQNLSLAHTPQKHGNQRRLQLEIFVLLSIKIWTSDLQNQKLNNITMTRLTSWFILDSHSSAAVVLSKWQALRSWTWSERSKMLGWNKILTQVGPLDNFPHVVLQTLLH